jgi:hypothetical protein
MATMLKSLLLPLLIVAVSLLLAAAWWGYGGVAWLMEYLPAHLRSIPPVYAHARPVDLGDPAVLLRLGVALVAVGATLAWGLLGWSRLSGSAGRRAAWLAAVAVGVVAVNAAFAHVRAGSESFERPFTRMKLEYYADVRLVGNDPLGFVRTYAAEHDRLSHHARTHPPGGVLFLWAGSRVFGESVAAAAWWAVGFSGLGVVLACLIARRLFGEQTPLGWVAAIYTLTPNLVSFGATCMDGVFNVFLLASVLAALRAVPLRGEVLRWGVVPVGRIAIAGATFWLAAFMTYTAVLVPLLLAALWGLLRWAGSVSMPARSTLVAAVGIAAVAVGCQLGAELAGYDLLACAAAAMERDLVGLGRDARLGGLAEWAGIGVGNLAAWGLASGAGLLAAAGVLGIAYRHSVPQVPLLLAVLTTALLLSFSTLFTLETERVWLCLTPMLLVATVCLPARPGPRWTLAALLLMQLLVIELCFDTLW